jgi:GT2 family glycosyltransferase
MGKLMTYFGMLLWKCFCKIYNLFLFDIIVFFKQKYNHYQNQKMKIFIFDGNENALSRTDYIIFCGPDFFKLSDSFEKDFKSNLSEKSPVIYFDHIEIDGLQNHHCYKPNWSPRLFESYDYIGQCFAVRGDIILTLQQQKISLTYHDVKKYVFENYHDVQRLPFFGFTQKKPVDEKSKISKMENIYDMTAHKASLIIPTKDNIDMLSTFINSILKSENKIPYEIIIVDNNSTEDKSHVYFEEIAKISNIQVLKYPKKFNWSKINNFAAQKATGDIFVFLNNDMEIITTNWLDQLCHEALKPNVGIVGAKLLFENESIQHAGMICRVGGFIEHIYRLKNPMNQQYPFISANLNREVLAVTGACHAITKEKFVRAGGYDENYIVCCSDVAICIQLNELNLKTIYMGSVALHHYESMTRDPKMRYPDENYRLLKIMWRYVLWCDPYYHPRLK